MLIALSKDRLGITCGGGLVNAILRFHDLVNNLHKLISNADRPVCGLCTLNNPFSITKETGCVAVVAFKGRC